MQYNRGRTEGVSAAMFLLAICGNMFYGASVSPKFKCRCWLFMFLNLFIN